MLKHPPKPNSVTMKMEVAQSSETSEQTHYTTRCKNPADHHLIIEYIL